MPVSTSTVTTAGSESVNARLRVSPNPSKKETKTETEKEQEKAGWEKHEQDFFWTYTEEPHRTRRRAIIAAHPEVTKLCGPEPLTKYIVMLVLGIQVVTAVLLKDTSFWSWRFWVTAYVVGATANQNLFLAIHEISHNLAFKKGWMNRVLAVVANLGIGVPYSASFRPYHLTHHKSLGVHTLDTDLPTPLEAVFLDSLLGKAFFCTFQILFYAIRPIFIYRVPFTSIHLFNIAAQVIFDVALVRFAGGKALGYLVLSSFLAGSLHPCAGHFIAEHYIFNSPKPSSSVDPLTQTDLPETFSYYGPLNYLTYNVGLHNEHHDFPAVPWTRLWKLNAIAREFYVDLPRCESWVGTIGRFIGDEGVGMRSRVKRREGGRMVGQWKEGETL